MAVLPPVIVPCVEPNHSLTTTEQEPSHSFVTTEAEPSHGFDACESLVLSVAANTMVVPLSWILYNSIATPASYNLYRKKIADVYFRLQVAGITANTYNDSSTAPGTTYQYQVRPVFTSGIEGLKSNIVQATTPALRYVYGFRANGLDVYDLLDPAHPALAASDSGSYPNIGLGVIDYADSDYLWIGNGGNLFTFKWSDTPTNPALVHTLPNDYGPPWTPPFHDADAVLIRRNLTDRNNLLIVFNSHNGSTGALESYNIADPANPVFINDTVVPAYIDFRGWAYDPVGHKIYNVVSNRFDTNYLMSWTLAADGTLGAATIVGSNIGSSSWNLGIIYGGAYWTWNQWGVFAPLSLGGSGFIGGYGGTMPGYGISSWTGCQPRVKGKYLFLAQAVSDAAHGGLLIMDLSTWTVVAELGALGSLCYGMVVAGTMLVADIGAVLHTWDITAMLANGSAPVHLGSVAESAAVNNLNGYFSDGWEGQNGGCSI